MCWKKDKEPPKFIQKTRHFDNFVLSRKRTKVHKKNDELLTIIEKQNINVEPTKFITKSDTFLSTFEKIKKFKQTRFTEKWRISILFL